MQARWTASRNHPILPTKGAVSAVHLALVPLSTLPPVSAPVRYGARADRWGRESVRLEEIAGWGAETKEVADDILRKCDALCDVWEAKVRDESEGSKMG